MFWSDPNLYGASFAYKDVGTLGQTPLGPTVGPWQNLPRFVPGGYPPHFNVPPMALNIPQTPHFNVPPMAFNVPQMGFNPQIAYHPWMGYNPPMGLTPPLGQIPTMGINPWVQTPVMNPYYNLPFYGWYRPFTF